MMKNPFAFKVTAPVLFSCNSLPRNLGDRSEASQIRFWMELKEAYPQLEKVRDVVSRRILYSGIELMDLEEVA